MTSAILTGAMALPLEAVHLASIKKALTVSLLPMGEIEPVIVLAYTLSKTHIHVPRQYGLSYCRRHGITIDDQTSPGTPVRFPKVPAPRDYQVGFIDDMVICTGEYYDFLAKAHTGFGKSISALIAAARLGVTTLIIVDQDNLKDQWLKELKTHFGMTVENGAVGIIQGKACTYDRAVVIAMVQTLSQKKFPEHVYEHFGLVIVDEVHTVGAPTFSQVLRQFPATYRFGVSATPKRTDGLQKLLDYNLGRVRVSATKVHDSSSVYFATHDTVYSWYANISPKIGRIITEVSEDGSRNLLLAEAAIFLYETGRDVLVLSDRIEQLKNLMALLYYMGVDDSEMGLYAGYDPSFAYAKEATPKRRPHGLVKHAETGNMEYTPVSLQSISKRMPKKALVQTKSDAKILFATFGMCAKGFDLPRLAGGVDATPRGQAEQIHGRILREVPGKKKPIWVTVLDTNTYRLVRSFANRAKDYEKSNAAIYEWHEDGELTECPTKELVAKAHRRVKALQSMSIVPTSVGLNMLQTAKSEKVQKAQHARDTVARIRDQAKIRK